MEQRRYRDRMSAGAALARALPPDLGEDVVVVGLARGGVETAAAVARACSAPLDALAVRKVGHPLQPEYGLGAVTPGTDGIFVRSLDGLSPRELEAVVAAELGAATEGQAPVGGGSPADATRSA